LKPGKVNDPFKILALVLAEWDNTSTVLGLEAGLELIYQMKKMD